MEALGINLPGLITQIVSFVILFAILYKLLYNPILNMLDQRSNKIKDGLETAERVRAEAEEERLKLRDELESDRADRERVMATARERAEQFREEEFDKALEGLPVIISNNLEQKTSVMIKLGKVKGNKMVDMMLSNTKLEDRGVRFVSDELNISYKNAEKLLKTALDRGVDVVGGIPHFERTMEEGKNLNDNINIGMKNKLNQLFKKFSLILSALLGLFLLIYILVLILLV